MSEATNQAALAAALAELFQEGSVLINDYRTPQISSRERAPWAVLAISDDVTAETGASWSTPIVRYRIDLTLLDYRRGRSEQVLLDGFQTLRQEVIRVLLTMAPPRVQSVQALTALGPYFNEQNEPDPDSLAQRLAIVVPDYEV